jgi:hypothetical protein
LLYQYGDPCVLRGERLLVSKAATECIFLKGTYSPSRTLAYPNGLLDLHIETFGRTPWPGDQPDARLLPTQDNTTEKHADTHPCPKQDSNLRSQYSNVFLPTLIQKSLRLNSFQIISLPFLGDDTLFVGWFASLLDNLAASINQNSGTLHHLLA